MAILTAEEIIEATGGELLSGNSGSFKGVSIDSRTIAGGDIFFALRGERFDGHDFVSEALLRGSGAIVDTEPGSLDGNKVVIQVGDTLKALQDLAHYMRMKRDIPVVAITGSNGKTTTKEMAYAVLSRRFKVLKNSGNLNNHIGLPLSLTKLSPHDEVIVLELGMNAPGEIRRLCEIAVPSHGIITNIGSAHIGRLGSYDAIRDAKLEILKGLTTAVFNGDDAFLMERAHDFKGKIITFSINSDSHVMAKEVRSTEKGNSFTLVFKDRESVPVMLNVHGIFNVYNALAASAVCFSLGIAVQEIKEALEAYTVFPMRFEVIKEKGLTVINDSYNANPSSISEALRELVRLGGEERTVAILGDMFELDEFSEDAHKAVGKMISELGVNVFAAVGEMIGLAAEECREKRDNTPMPTVYTFRNVDDAMGNIMNVLKQGDTVLIKGSRSMRMDRIAEGIINAV
jgi:UDP-N-acetylmuramoyl-tripeptide--D-alanyl-D-alanine ligase